MHIKQWERDTGQTFRINGLQFEPYVKKQHDDFAAEKENEKLLRVSLLEVLLNYFLQNVKSACLTAN